MNSDKVCTHKSKESKKPRPGGKADNKSNGSSNGQKELNKKSLSFFPDEGDSDDDQSGKFVDNESSSKPGNEHQDHQNDGETQRKSKADVIGDPDNTASSCSCDDHSSPGAHSDEDPHGDLDYDDDSEAGSPSNRRALARSREDTSDPLSSSINENTDNLHDSRPSSNLNNPNGNSQEGIKNEDASHIDEGSDGSLPDQKPTKIQSFINFDTGRECDEDELDSGTKRQSKDRLRKSYESLLKQFFKDACFFQMKSINHENVQISKSMGVWQTPIQNELRLNSAYREHRNVILIFSVQQSGAFQGFARMTSESRPPVRPVPWVLPARLSNAAVGGVIPLDWLCTKELNFTETRDLYNPLNNNKPVKVARDGQQVDQKVGRKLCSLFPKDSKKRLLVCLQGMKDEISYKEQIDLRGYPLVSDHSDNVPRRRYHLGAAHDSEMVIDQYDAILDPATSHNQRHHPGVYSRPPDEFVGPPAPTPVRSRISGDIWSGQSNRLRPHFDISSYPRPPASYHYDHYHMRDVGYGPRLAPHFPNGYQGDFYTNPYGPDYYHPEFMQHHFASQQQSSRAYTDWHYQSRGRNAAPLGPGQRFHPYQRTRR